MAKLNENKRKRYSNLSDVEAEEKRKLANKQERDRVCTIKKAFDTLESLLFKTSGDTKNSKLQILNAAIEFVIQNGNCAGDKKVAEVHTDMMHPNNVYQEQNIVQNVQHMRLSPKHEIPARPYIFPAKPSTFACGSDQIQCVTGTKQQTNMYHGGDQFYLRPSEYQLIKKHEQRKHGAACITATPECSSEYQRVKICEKNKHNARSSTETSDGPSEYQGVKICEQAKHEAGSSSDTLDCPLEYQRVKMVEQLKHDARYSIDTSEYQRLKIYNEIMQDIAQKLQIVPQNTGMSRYINSSSMMQCVAETPQNIPQNSGMPRYLSSKNMMQDAAQIPPNVPRVWPVPSTISFKW